MGIKISALTPVVTPALSDVFPIVQAGVTYKESGTQLSSLFALSGANANITSLTGITGYIQAPLGIKDSSGNIVLSFEPVASAVNHVSIVSGAASGAGVGIQALGTDSNIPFGFASKGNAPINFQAAVIGSSTSFEFFTGTALQHTTSLVFSDTAANRAVTFPDATGTIVLASKANGTEAANAVTASGTTGVITTSALTTAGGANYAITWTNTFMTTASIIQLTLMGGTNTTKNTTMQATAGAGTSTLTIYNNTAATALNGTILIGYMIIP